MAIAANVSTLGYFKYYDFIAAEITNLARTLNLNLDPGSSGIPLPVAISFLTFHAISYLADIYQRAIRPTRSLLDLSLYFSFFPHLVAGPIVKARDFLGQLQSIPSRNAIELGKSARLILFGLFKKVVIAGNLSIFLVDPVFQTPTEFTQFDLLLAMYGYALVIYCDFSAYTDIAIGIADLLGYKFPQNFNQPYRAASLQDFWRRWHMTLSGWLRDYVYIPLGGNRSGRVRTQINILVTMVLGGLWHGAGMQFIVWGAWHGLGLVIEAIFRNDRLAQRSNFVKAIAIAFVFHFVCFGWIFFRSPDLASALLYFQSMIYGKGEMTLITPQILALLSLGALTQLIPRSLSVRFEFLFEHGPIAIGLAISIVMIVLTALFAPPGIPPFIYFQF